MPTKKLPGQELTLEQQRANQALHQRRLRIEHVNSSVKRCRIVKDRIRLWKEGVRDVVMEICCALQNFRVRITARQPMAYSAYTQSILSSRARASSGTSKGVLTRVRTCVGPR